MDRSAIALLLFQLEEPTLAQAAREYGSDPEEILALRRCFVEENGRVALVRIRAPSPLREIAEWILSRPSRLGQLQEARTRTLARPPGAAPPRSVVDATSLYSDEADQLAALLEKPYAMLIWRDCLEVAHEGEPFLPAEYLRYFAPALAEHAGSICGRMSAHYDVECLAAALAKALPLEQPGRLAADLRRGIAARHPGSIDSLRQVWPPRWGGRGWRQPDGSGPGFPKLLVLVCELDGSSAENVALFASDEPAIVATLVEHDAGVLALGWRPDNPSAAALYTVEAVLARLERIASSRHSVLAESARALIERR